MTLNGKTIMITGGGRGIGSIIAIACAMEGADLILLGRSQEPLNLTAARINSLGRSVETAVVDVGDRKSVVDFVAALEADGRSVDCLVNNAAIQGPIGMFGSTSIDEWENNIRTSLMGTVYCCHAMLALMIKRGSGSIVNFSGGGSTAPRMLFSAYGVAKTAVVRFTETIAAEYKNTELRINSVAPGAINTGMLEEILAAGSTAGPELAQAKNRKNNGGDDPRHISELITFLASDTSVGITGKLISAIWDPWREPAFQQRLRNEPELATLRRIDDRNFVQVKQ